MAVSAVCLNVCFVVFELVRSRQTELKSCNLSGSNRSIAIYHRHSRWSFVEVHAVEIAVVLQPTVFTQDRTFKRTTSPTYLKISKVFFGRVIVRTSTIQTYAHPLANASSKINSNFTLTPRIASITCFAQSKYFCFLVKSHPSGGLVAISLRLHILSASFTNLAW